jgi:hypothetical protein
MSTFFTVPPLPRTGTAPEKFPVPETLLPWHFKRDTLKRNQPNSKSSELNSEHVPEWDRRQKKKSPTPEENEANFLKLLKKNGRGEKI